MEKKRYNERKCILEFWVVGMLESNSYFLNDKNNSSHHTHLLKAYRVLSIILSSIHFPLILTSSL